MPPKRRTTRTTPATTTTPTTTVTNAQLQALIDQGVAAALAERDASRSRDGNNSHGSGTGGRRKVPTQREFTYTDFLKCQPINFKGTEGVVGLTQWAEKMESVFLISNCAITSQVKYASCTLQGSALTWWNSHVRAVGQDVAYTMPWTALKRMITDKYCPRGEIKKLESEYWNLKVRGTDLMTYNQRFQELALMCDRMFPEESAKVERSDCPKLKNGNQGNRAGNGNAVARALFLLIDIIPTTLDHGYDVELADGRIIWAEDKSKEKQLEELLIVQDFPEVFPEDLPGIPPTRQVEFQIDLIPGAASASSTGHLIDLDSVEMKRINKQEHAEHLKLILELVKKEQLYAKFSKCEFWIPKVQFLGHVIDSQGIHVDPAKIESVKDWAFSSVCNGEIRQFLGLAGSSEDSLKDSHRSSSQLSQAHSKKKIRLIGVTRHEAGLFPVDQAELCSCTNSRFPKGNGWTQCPVCTDPKSLQQSRSEGIKHEMRQAVERNEIKPLRVRALVMTIGLDLPKRILEAQIEARKPENLKSEDVGVFDVFKSQSRTPKTFAYWVQPSKYLKEVGTISLWILSPNSQERKVETTPYGLCTRLCDRDIKEGWEGHLPLIEFSYNNSYHASIKAAPFEALYGRKCRSPVCWAEVGDARLTGPELVHETTEKIVQIKHRMQAARDRQKSYADVRRKPLEFQVGDRVMLKVSPWKGVVRFGKRGKLNPRYIGPFKVLAKVGTVAYRLELPQQLSRVHSTFHVSNLKKCLSDEPLAVPLDEIHIDDKLHFVEEPVEILDREVKKLRRSRIPIIKVRWNSKRGPEFTWEREDQFREKYPHLFTKTAPSKNAAS
ncbi:putative reverse transcriptase domain-containing protein [Tanacetum coccineum]